MIPMSLSCGFEAGRLRGKAPLKELVSTISTTNNARDQNANTETNKTRK